MMDRRALREWQKDDELIARIRKISDGLALPDGPYEAHVKAEDGSSYVRVEIIGTFELCEVRVWQKSNPLQRPIIRFLLEIVPFARAALRKIDQQTYAIRHLKNHLAVLLEAFGSPVTEEQFAALDKMAEAYRAAGMNDEAHVLQATADAIRAVLHDWNESEGA